VKKNRGTYCRDENENKVEFNQPREFVILEYASNMIEKCAREHISEVVPFSSKE